MIVNMKETQALSSSKQVSLFRHGAAETREGGASRMKWECILFELDQCFGSKQQRPWRSILLWRPSTPALPSPTSHSGTLWPPPSSAQFIQWKWPNKTPFWAPPWPLTPTSFWSISQEPVLMVINNQTLGAAATVAVVGVRGFGPLAQRLLSSLPDVHLTLSHLRSLSYSAPCKPGLKCLTTDRTHLKRPPLIRALILCQLCGFWSFFHPSAARS